MVFVDALGIVYGPEDRWGVKLRHSDDGLQEEQDVSYSAKDGMGGFKVTASMRDFVVLDHDEAGEKGEGAGGVEDGVNMSALNLLLGGMGWLEEEDALSDDEDTGRVEELRRVDISGESHGVECRMKRTGWAAKRMSGGCVKTDAHTVTVSWESRISRSCWMGENEGTNKPDADLSNHGGAYQVCQL